jgi:hypothetical protein
LEVNTKKKFVETEGLATFSDILDATYKKGFMPAVVPDYRKITIGGAISGLGVEATSFKYGMVHENIIEAEVLTGNAEILKVSENLYPELFVGLVNSLGTLGYILKCKMRIIPVKKFIFVKLNYFDDAKKFFDFISLYDKNITFLDGIIFNSHKFVVMSGYFADSVDKDNKLFDIYKGSWSNYLERTDDKGIYFNFKDYIWRWDSDVFWGTRELGFIGKLFEMPLLRKTVLKPVLRSDRLLKIHHILAYNQSLPNFFTVISGRREQLIQDVGIEFEKCRSFYNWYNQTISVYPNWICPVRRIHPESHYPLFLWHGSAVNDIGFYAYKELKKNMSSLHYNKLLERELRKYQGVKGLYSTSYFSKEEFWKMYDYDRYKKIKSEFDPQNVFPDLYEKVVGSVTK